MVQDVPSALAGCKDSWSLPAGKFPHHGPALTCSCPPAWFHTWNSSPHPDAAATPDCFLPPRYPVLCSPLLLHCCLSRSFWAPPPLPSRQIPAASSSLSTNSITMKLSMILSNTQGLVSPCSHQPVISILCCDCLFACKCLPQTPYLRWRSCFVLFPCWHC